MKKIILIFIILCSIIIFYKTGNWLTSTTSDNSGDYVVLLHGLGRSSWSMHKLGSALARSGYRVININYPSQSDSIENLVKNIIAEEIEKNYVDKSKQINFVTHSMGGAITRYYLDQEKIENLGRVVMIAPPNKGAEIADDWSNNFIKRLWYGPAIEQMNTSSKSLVNTLPLPDYKFGVIAGLNDEKVSVERTKLDTMEDFIIVNNEHTFIMMSNDVIQSTINYIETGKFK